MARLPAIAGGARARNNCSRKNARLPNRESSRLKGVTGKFRRKRRLPARFYASDALRPMLLKLDVSERQIFHCIDVMEHEVVARAGLEEFLLNRQPGSFVNPHLYFDDLVANLLGFGSEFKHDCFLVVEFFFANDGHQVALPDVVALCSEPEKHILIDHRTVLAEVELFHAVDLWIEQEEGVAGAQDRARIRLGDFDAHFLVAANVDVAGFRRGVLHDRGVFDVLDIGGERMEVLRGLVHHSEDASDGPISLRLRGARSKRACSTAKNQKCEKKE